MVVRELIALLGVKTDTASVKKADNSLKGVMGRLKGIAAAAIGVWATVRGGLGIVELASDANETLNVLNASFGRNQQAVMDWAAAFSKAAGRSEYDMREMAGTLGAVLNPMMEGNQEVAAQMSTRLSELAVDLGSFFNAMEPDVLMALRSGLTGEAEPLKRFGIVMTEATLANFAMNSGITKSVKSMTIAEKTALRYNYILDVTKNAHGDAAKTALGWANATKGLVAKLKDAGTRIGFFLLPVLEKAVVGSGKWIDNNQGLIDGIGDFIGTLAKMVGWLIKFVFNLPPGAKIGLVAIAFLKWGKALKFLLSPFGKIMILIALLVLIIQDLITWVEGGDSVFGRFFDTLDELTGLPIGDFFKEIIKWFMRLAEDPVAAFEELIGVVAESIQWWAEQFEQIWNDVTNYFKELWQSIVEWFSESVVNPIVNFFLEMWNNPMAAIEGFLDFLIDIGVRVVEILTTPFREVITFIKDVFEVGIVEAFNRLGEKIKGWATGIYDAIAKPFKRAAEFLGLTGEESKGATTALTGFRTATQGARISKGGGMIPGAARAAAGARSLTQNTDIQVSVKGGPGTPFKSGSEMGTEIATQIRKEMEKQNRAAMQALTPAKAE